MLKKNPSMKMLQVKTSSTTQDVYLRQKKYVIMAWWSPLKFKIATTNNFTHKKRERNKKETSFKKFKMYKKHTNNGFMKKISRHEHSLWNLRHMCLWRWRQRQYVLWREWIFGGAVESGNVSFLFFVQRISLIMMTIIVKILRGFMYVWEF